MSQSSIRPRPHKRSIIITSSSTIPFSTLFSRPTVVDLLVVGGGGQGAASEIVTNTVNKGNGGGGGGGGSVIEYTNVWVTSDLIVTVGAGGASQVPIDGSNRYAGSSQYATVNPYTSYGSYNNDGEQSSVSFSNPGPFSGVYTAPGGESGGFSVQGGYGAISAGSGPIPGYSGSRNSGDIPGTGVGFARVADEQPPSHDMHPTRYNSVHSSINAFTHKMKNFVGTPLERYTYGVSIFSEPLYYMYNPTAFTYNDSGAYSGPNDFYPLMGHDYQMVMNPGRGKYNGSTGGLGGGVFDTQKTGDQTSATSGPANLPGGNGSSFADGYNTNKTTHPYGAGGGGGSRGTGVLGGVGVYGAGNGASENQLATAALPNTGGGGGGGHPLNPRGAAGGSGLVVISWDE